MSIVAETATLVHGYTMDDIDRCSRIAVSKTLTRVLSHIDHADRRSIAWLAIAEHLYQQTERPEFGELLTVGTTAILRTNSLERSYRGLPSNGEDRMQAPRYSQYWGFEEVDVRPAGTIRTGGAHGDTDFTDGLVERMALPAALGVLTDVEYETIAALAAHGTVKAAAAALGLKQSLFSKRLGLARRHFLEVWYAPETPQRRRGRGDDDACRYGHPRSEHSYRDSTGKWMCRLCGRNKTRRQRARER